MPTKPKPNLYNTRHPERTLLYQTVAEHYETWLELASAGQFDGQGDHQHIFAIMYFPACRCASGCCRSPSGCATSCNAMG